MKVLLIGEYSGFFTNLKKGLEKIGVTCVLASNQDVWKKIDGTDIQLYKTTHKNLFGKIYNLFLEPILSRKKLYGYDVVQFVNPSVYPSRINTYMVKKIKKHSGKMFVSIAGDCLPVYESYKKGLLGYYIYDNNIELVDKYESGSGKSRRIMKTEEECLLLSDGIIPIMYEYAVGVREMKQSLKTIPIPFDCSDIEYRPNKIKNGKIVIFHGLIREEAKGTKYILEALEIIKQRHPNEVEIIVDGKKPLKEYLEMLSEVNILVDQCKEHCYGMNALYAMAEGRVVLGGASENSLTELGLSECPVIHIEPNVQQIVAQLEYVISQKEHIEKLGEQSRRFVEKFHDCERVAQEYIKAWNNV